MADAGQTAPVRLRRGAVAVVVTAQWLGTSLWFSPSGVADGLMAHLGIGAGAFGALIAATQIGFIAGTLGIAVSGVADRHRASRIFAIGGLVGAAANAAVAWPGLGYSATWGLRFVVGMCLAGIYPLGMKMIVQWVGARPALALAWLVGMLTLGTAMPHALRASGTAWTWQLVLVASSALALVGAAAVVVLGDGPHGAAPSPAAAQSSAGRAVREVFAVPGFRASAFGYFGHMWELYAFWSVVPWLCRPIAVELARRGGRTEPSPTFVALLAFSVIAVGALGCVAGGLASRRLGSARVAALALAGSGAMCLLYPLIPGAAVELQLASLLFWGVCVIADSPQFSALSAGYAPPQWLGSALVVQNGIGFAITVVSILVMGFALPAWGPAALWLLAPGPLLGLSALRPLLSRGAAAH